MPSTIQFANAEQLALFLQFYQQYYAAAQVGSTPVDIAVGLQFTETGGKLIAGQISNAQIAALSKAGTVTLDTTAAQAFQQYLAAGGTTSNSLAATGAVTNEVVANGTIATTSTGAKVVGLLSMNLPTAAAAIAPLAGVALGAGLYSTNPELWEKISRALLPFCYDDTELLPVAVDENGNTYFPQEAVDGVRAVINASIFDTASYPGLGLENAVSPYPFPYSVTNSVDLRSSSSARWHHFATAFTGNPKVFVGIFPGGAITLVAASESPFTYTGFEGNPPSPPIADTPARLKTYRGRTYYSTFISSSGFESNIGVNSNVPICTPIDLSGSAIDNIAYAMLYGDMSIQEQTGVSKWNGQQYPSSAESIDIVTSIDGQNVETASYQPIATPIGEPGVSLSPEQAPNLTENKDKAAAIDPWITGNPSLNTYPSGVEQSNSAPLDNPVPERDPVLDPNADPSKTPPKDPITTTTGTTPPVNGGTSSNPQIPIVPVLPSAATGLLHVYNPTQTQLDAFGVWLWTTFSGDLIDTLSKLFNNPMDAVIGLHELYATPSVSGGATIRAGYLDSNVPSNLVGSRYTSINCGSIVVEEFYQNYLDYSPYTKCYIYLPFVGIVPVLADDIVGNAVNVTYHIDSYTGCCIAVVTVAREGYSSTVYQFEGNCAVEIPITSGYQSTLMGALIGIGATALTGNPHAGIAAANMGRASLGKNDVSHSGSFGSSYGAMGAKTPYIIVKRPTQKSVVNYNQDYGFPAHKRVTIGACSGYLRAREVHVISPTATDEEKARIEELLKSGVFVQ